LSSTTELPVAGRDERGQVLVLFGGAIFTLLVVAALAFDVGTMLLERRDEQNAADAAALAGARYIFDVDCVAPTWTCTKARAAAAAMAIANGYDDADPIQAVQIHIPPVHGRYISFPNFIEVEVGSQRDGIFAGIIGRSTWPVGVFATATNDQDLTFPFSMLALNPTACKAIHVSGNGLVEAYGNVQSNSNGTDCVGEPYGFSRTGNGDITILADDATCRSAGEIQDDGVAGSMVCTKAENSFALPDPLRNLPAPTKPALAAAMVQIDPSAKTIQPRCPGATGADAPTETQTTGCDIAGNGGGSSSSRGTFWLLSPGLYPAGISIDNDSTAYLLPGIYWIGGGGFVVDGNASLFSVSSLAEAQAMYANRTNFPQVRALFDAGGGGVMIYNTSLPTSAAGPVTLGHNNGNLLIKPFFDPVSDPPDQVEDYNHISVFQDRTVTQPVTFNGGNADAEVAGIVYVPAGHLTINGSSSEFVVDQIIADSFKINGSTGTIQILKRVGVDAVITAAGLVD
jgi:hypothetical protein